MRVAVDTNVLVRAVVRDDVAQAKVAAKVLTDAELIAVALPCLCEFVWVLLRVYAFQATDAAAAIRASSVEPRKARIMLRRSSTVPSTSGTWPFS